MGVHEGDGGREWRQRRPGRRSRMRRNLSAEAVRCWELHQWWEEVLGDLHLPQGWPPRVRQPQLRLRGFLGDHHQSHRELLLADLTLEQPPALAGLSVQTMGEREAMARTTMQQG